MVSLLFGLWVFASVVFAGLDIGLLPLRSILLIALFIWAVGCLLQRPSTRALIRKSSLLKFGVFLIFVSGFIQSIVPQPWSVYFTTLMRYLLQPLMLATILIVLGHERGPRRVFAPFIFVVSASAAVAVMQMLGFDFAWQIREAFGGYQDEGSGSYFYIHRDRAMGLSLNPVQLGYQCLIALIGTSYLKRIHAVSTRMMFLVSSLMVIGIVAAGLRSAFLGAAISLGCSMFFIGLGKRATYSAVALIGMIGIAYVLIDVGRTDLRVTDYNSATNSRLVLNAYSLRLFSEQPLGYGLGFDTRTVAKEYIDEFRRLPSSEAMKTHAPHNALAVFSLTYGLLGLGTLGVYIWSAVTKDIVLGLGILGYLVNSGFHNAGIFVGDHFVLFVLVAVELCRRVPRNGPSSRAVQSSSITYG